MTPSDRPDAAPVADHDHDHGPDHDPRRHNARTHGLTASIAASEAERVALEEAAARFARELGPDIGIEDALVRRAAVADVRLQRSERAQELALGTNSREALRRWQDRRRKAVRRKGQDLKTDPAGVVAELEGSAFGCDWLIGQWRRLDGAIRGPVGWDIGNQYQALALLSHPMHEPGPASDPDARRLFWLGRAASGLVRPGEQDEPGVPHDREAARPLLLAFIADRIARLELLRDEAWETVEGPESEAVAAAGMEDTSKAGQLRKRYEREAELSLIRCVSMLLRVRDSRRKAEIHESKRASRGRSSFATVGDGRLREPDTSPAPAVPMPVPPRPVAEVAAEAPAARPASPAAPISRNERDPDPPKPPSDRPNKSSENDLRLDPSGRPVEIARRTEPRTEPDRPRHPAPDRPLDDPGPPRSPAERRP